MEPFLRSDLSEVHIFDLPLQLPSTPTSFNDIFELFFADKSTFFAEWHLLNGSRLESLTPWEGGLREQHFFIKGVNSGETRCVEQHRWETNYDDGSHVYEASNKLIGAPFSEYFKVEFRAAFSLLEDQGVIRCVCSAGVSFSFYVPLASKISAATTASFKDSTAHLEKLMVDVLGTPTPLPHAITSTKELPPVMSMEDFCEAMSNPAMRATMKGEKGYLSVGANGTVELSRKHKWWRVERAGDQDTIALQCEETGRYLGIDIFGAVVAKATLPRSWEHLRLRFVEGCGVCFIGVPSFRFKAGGFVIQDISNPKRLACISGDECGPDQLAQFTLRLHSGSAAAAPKTKPPLADTLTAVAATASHRGLLLTRVSLCLPFALAIAIAIVQRAAPFVSLFDLA